MKSLPKISIVAPVYNVEKYLHQCLDSLVNQTFKEIEIILVDDGATDSSGRICDEYAARDARIKVIHQSNQGVSMARKNGALATTAPFLMFVDADDWLNVNTCAIVYDRAKKNDADVVIFSYRREYSNNSIPVEIFREDKNYINDEVRNLQRRVIGLIGKELREPFKFDSLTATYMRLIKRELILNNQVSFIDTRIMFPGEDTIFNIELFNFAKRVIYINKPLYHYRREVATSATASFNPKYFDKWLGHLYYIKEYITKHRLGSDFEKAFKNRVCCEFIGLSMKETNPINPRSFSERLEFLKMVLNHELYKPAFHELETRFMPPHWRAFFLFCKMQFTPGIYFMAKAMRTLRSKY